MKPSLRVAAYRILEPLVWYHVLRPTSQKLRHITGWINYKHEACFVSHFHMMFLVIGTAEISPISLKSTHIELTLNPAMSIDREPVVTLQQSLAFSSKKY